MSVEQLPSTSKPLGLRKLRGRKGWEERKGRAGGRKEGERKDKQETRVTLQKGKRVILVAQRKARNLLRRLSGTCGSWAGRRAGC